MTLCALTNASHTVVPWHRLKLRWPCLIVVVGLFMGRGGGPGRGVGARASGGGAA